MASSYKKPLTTRGWDLVDYNSETNKLPILTINMTALCNLKCVYCHTDARTMDKNELTLKEHKYNIDQAFDLGTKVLWIGGKGEPTLDPTFKKVIEHSKKKDLVTILNTNGTTIDSEMAKFLYDHDVSPELKIISFNEKAYDLLAGISGMMPKMQEGLDNLLKAGYDKVTETETERITRISGMILLAKQSLPHIPEVFHFCNQHNINPVVSDIVPAGRIIKNANYHQLRISVDENKELYKTGSAIMGYPLNTGTENCDIKNGIFIENNGNVITTKQGLSCDIQYGGNIVIIGNTKDMSLENIWEMIKSKRTESQTYLKTRCTNQNNLGCFGSCQTAKDAIKYYQSIIR